MLETLRYERNIGFLGGGARSRQAEAKTQADCHVQDFPSSIHGASPRVCDHYQGLNTSLVIPVSHFLLRSMSAYTARMMITPVTTVCHSCATDRMRRPLVSTLMMNAPMMVPSIVPAPPLSDVPPMTTAAIASSS